MSEAFRHVPTLRFPQFSEPWVEERGGEFFRQRRERGEEGLPLYSVTIESGMVRRDSLEREITSNASDDFNLRANKGDIVYNMMRMWQGSVGRAPEVCMVSPAYVVLSPKPKTSPHFFEHWFKRTRSIYWLWAYSHGLTNDRLRLYFRDFAKIPMRIPTLPEQQKIAGFLGSVDERIKLLEQQQNTLTRYKKGMMQKLFSQTIRFARGDGSSFPEWIEFKLGDKAKFSKGKGISKDDIVADGRTPCVRYGELYTTYSEKIGFARSYTNANVEDLFMSRAGDVILPASGEAPLDMASASCVLVEGVALGADLNVVRSPIDGLFLAYLLRSIKRRDIAQLAQGNSIVHLSGTHLASLSVTVPSDLLEQHKIADFLSALDDKIMIVSEQLSQMQAFKEGLLQRMFV